MSISTINDLLLTIDKNRDIVLSMDLDNTLVNRSKGDNYIPPNTLKLIKLLQSKNNFYLIPNTGRDIVGFNAFIKETTNFQDAILGSGGLMKVNNKYIFNNDSAIVLEIIQLFVDAVKNNILPFVDFTHKDGRLLIYNDNGLELKDLFFSQNPRSWFGKELPLIVPVILFKEKIENIYRIEFPVLSIHQTLFEELVNKRENGIGYLAKILGIEAKKINNYTIKRKVFFNNNYKDKLIFGRFEKNTNTFNKGQCLKTLLHEKHLDDANVIHVGDQDYGVINDTLVKKELPQARLVMVGERCQKNNSLVDLYLFGDTDTKVYEFFKLIHLLLF
jgi:hydroxymethylpyrimidine pyrophosphatase-like HAD family hydrolase